MKFSLFLNFIETILIEEHFFLLFVVCCCCVAGNLLGDPKIDGTTTTHRRDPKSDPTSDPTSERGKIYLHRDTKEPDGVNQVVSTSRSMDRQGEGEENTTRSSSSSSSSSGGARVPNIVRVTATKGERGLGNSGNGGRGSNLLLQSVVEDMLVEHKTEIKNDIQNVHIELLRQFQLQFVSHSLFCCCTFAVAATAVTTCTRCCCSFLVLLISGVDFLNSLSCLDVFCCFICNRMKFVVC